MADGIGNRLAGFSSRVNRPRTAGCSNMGNGAFSADCVGDLGTGDSHLYAKTTVNMRETLSRFSSSRSFRWGFGMVISFFALFLAGKNVNIHEVGRVLKEAIPGYVILAVGSVLVNNLSKILRWRVLLGSANRNVGLLQLAAATMIGQLVNLFVPGRVGELSRVVMIGHGVGQGRTFVLGTIVLEKWVDILAYALLFLILFILMPLPDWMEGSVFTLVGMITLGGGLLAGMIYFHASFTVFLIKLVHYFPERFRGWVLPRIETAMSSLKNLRKGSDLFAVIFWTITVWATAFLNNLLIMLALRMDVSVSSVLLLLISLQAGIVVSASPGTVGIFEYICILALSVFGVSQVFALGYGILLHAVLLLPQMVLGLLSFFIWGMRVQSLPTHSISEVD